jgi:hypothetical protein
VTTAQKWTADRAKLADRLASGLAGWLQTKACEDVEHAIGEDAARFVCAEIINAQHRFRAALSEKPSNWDAKSKERLDIKLLGARAKANAKTAYGFIELKWPILETTDWKGTRRMIVEDAVRVLSATTANLNASFMILGVIGKVEDRLFDKTHKKPDLEDSRQRFAKLFVRATGSTGSLSLAELQATFPSHSNRVPMTQSPVTSKITAKLLAQASAVVGSTNAGKVYVWQINKYA